MDDWLGVLYRRLRGATLETASVPSSVAYEALKLGTTAELPRVPRAPRFRHRAAETLHEPVTVQPREGSRLHRKRAEEREEARAGMCRRHPRACHAAANRRVDWTEPGASSNNWTFATPLPPPLPAAVRALHELAGAWCLSREGCIASTWRADRLPQPQRSWLRGPPGSSCFDGSRPSHFAFERCAVARSGGARLPGGRGGSGRVAREGARLSPVFDGEFGFELLHALPFLQWLQACDMLQRTAACRGMEAFYSAFRRPHESLECSTRPSRSRWRADSLPLRTVDGWSRRGKHSYAFYAYPSGRWLPPPLHAAYRARPLPLAPRASASVGSAADASRADTTRATPRAHGPGAGARGGGGRQARGVRRVWVQNKFYPEGHGFADNFWSVPQLRLILDTLLGCGFDVLVSAVDSKWVASGLRVDCERTR